MTEAALQDAAIFYLARFATSAANLRRVLARKALQSARHHGDDPAPLMAAVDAIVAASAASGAVNDELYAQSQLAKLRRRGGSARAIRGRLAAKGLGAPTIDAALAGNDAEGADFTAAVALARRRKLGPFRVSGRAENRMRDLAILGRAGFDFGTAAAVVDAASSEDLTE